MPQVIAEAIYAIVDYLGVEISATALGAYATAVTVISYAASAALLYAAEKALTPSAPKGVGRGMEVTVTDATAPARIILGKVKVGGVNVIPPFTSGANGETIHQVIALAGHEVDSYVDVYFNQDKISNTDIAGIGGVTNDGLVGSGTYASLAYIRRYTGSASQTADYRLKQAFPTAFTTDFRGRGIAYAACDLVFNQNVYTSGYPQITFEVKGAKCYDPRLDASPGASPTNPTYIAWTQNPALQLAWYLMSDLGGGYDSDEIDWDLVVAAANICDSSLSGGNAPPSGAEARYTCNIMLEATTDIMQNIKAITDTMLGRVIYRDGLWRIYAGAWDSPVHSMDQTAFIGPVTISASKERDQRYNGVRVFIVNPSKNWQRTECFPRSNDTYKANDGSERIWKEIEIPGISNEYQGQRVGEFLLRQSRNQISISGRVGPRWLKLGLWETVSFTWDTMGWASKTFRVVAYTLNPDGTADIGLSEEQASDWTDLATGDYNSPSTSTMPSVNPTTPSAPQNFSINALNGEIEFTWDAPIINPHNTRYQLWRSPGSLWNANSSELVWKGDTESVLMAFPGYSLYWWHVRGMVQNSSFGPFSPNTYGLFGRPFLNTDTSKLNRAYPNGEFNFPLVCDSYFVPGRLLASGGGVNCASFDRNTGMSAGRGSIVWTSTPGRSSGNQSGLLQLVPTPGELPDHPVVSPSMRGSFRFSFMRLDSGQQQFFIDLYGVNANVSSKNGAYAKVGSILNSEDIWPLSYYVGSWNTVVISIDLPNTPTLTHIMCGIREYTAGSGHTRIGEWQVLLN